METLGHELRHRREELNIGLREVSEATRIGMRFLHAIEADDFSAIPGGIYARSFIRAYAKYVGMDEEDAVSRYRKQTNQNEDEMDEPQPSREFPGEPSQLSLGLVVLGLLAVIGVGGFAAARYFSSSNKPPVSTAPTNNPPVVATPVPASQPAQSAAQQAATPGNLPNSDSAKSQAANAAVQQVAQAGDNLVLAFTASGESWLSVQPDDQPPARTLIQSGQTREFKATSKFEVTVGNLPAVQIRINGQPAQLPTANGLFANVTISKENYKEYVAASPAGKPKQVANRPKSISGQGIAGAPKPTSNLNVTATGKPAGSAGSSTGLPVKPPTPSKPAGSTGGGSHTATVTAAKPESQKPKTEAKPDGAAPKKPAEKSADKPKQTVKPETQPEN